MPAVSRVRIGRIRSKAGNLAVLNTGRTVERQQVDRLIRSALDQHAEDIAGIAFVSWSADGSWMAEIANFDTSPLRLLEVPQFAQRRLAHKIGENFTVDRVKRMLGWD